MNTSKRDSIQQSVKQNRRIIANAPGERFGRNTGIAEGWPPGLKPLFLNCGFPRPEGRGFLRRAAPQQLKK